MLGCDTFVFVAFLEFTMAQYLLRKSTTQIVGLNFINFSLFTSMKCGFCHKFNLKKVRNGAAKSKCIPSSDNDDEFWVDQVSKILFPSAFFLFNLAFWCFAIFGNQGDVENILAHGYIKL